MIALALLPLGVYFFMLARCFARSTPTVLNGAQDLTLLAWGLFGLITLGPGRLIVPIDVLAMWGAASWLFWTAFYFITARFFSERARCSIFVYHCSLEKIISHVLEFGRANNLSISFQGNVLDLPSYEIQCTVNGTQREGHVVFKPTGPSQSREGWEQFEQDLEIICYNIQLARWNRHWFVFQTVSLGLLAASAMILYWQLPHIVALYVDYWG